MKVFTRSGLLARALALSVQSQWCAVSSVAGRLTPEAELLTRTGSDVVADTLA